MKIQDDGKIQGTPEELEQLRMWLEPFQRASRKAVKFLAALEPVDIVRAWLVKRWEEYDLAKWVMEEVNERMGDPDDYESEAAHEAAYDRHWQEVHDSEEFCVAKRCTRDESERMFLHRMPNVTGDLIDAIADVRHEDVVELLHSKGYHDKLPFDLLYPYRIE
ncbi:hypothetical protein [Burkholderia vietnamiensis]|uniref:hypothetical protein n=1 Tax=Burkholderia vietnamiensis TaxID=60552 RepID=UPI001CF5F7E4|nr:hypothetical protein [Burkholderia vietnamiensis]MCA8448911.1 hypothetical protein [Burkholderia vietnamiensis]